MDARACYNANGNFDPELYYVALYNSVPCKYEYGVDDDYELDIDEMKFDKIKHFFSKIDHIHTYLADYLENESEVQKVGFETVFPLDNSAKPNQAYIVFAADHRVFHINKSKIAVYYPESEDVNKIAEFAKEIFNTFPVEEPESREGKVSLIKVYQGDYYTSEKDVKPKIVNIEENYNDDFLSIDKDVTEFLKDRSSGLILLYGEPGTGKTSYIRHLISAVPKEYIIVPSSIAQRLGDPDLTTFITDHTDSVFILEDCEQLLEDREENQFNNAIATILNMADGLLSDIVNIKFICTFNAPITQIDKALLRKGRCIAKYQFNKLKADKVRILNEKYNLGHTKIEDMTLADIYNADKPDYTEETKQTKIGF